jgi:putative transposase
MNDGGYKIRKQAAIHFVTFSVVEWIDVFTRKLYRDIVLDSLHYCQGNKFLLLHSWCIMSNHLHLIASSVIATLLQSINQPRNRNKKLLRV